MVKILVCGEVRGRVGAVFSKVASLNSGKAGPFDLLLCVGAFSGDDDAELEAYLPRQQPQDPAATASEGGDVGGGGGGEDPAPPSASPPIPTYFYEPGPSEQLGGLLKQHDTQLQELAPKLFYLGRGGIKTVGKLTMAFLSDTHTEEDLDAARRIGNMGGYRGADVLLSSEWPRGFDADLPDSVVSHLAALGVPAAGVGSTAVADMAVTTRPRYHFAAGQSVYFSRAPYRNALEGGDAATASGRASHVTRLVCLGDCGAPAGDKDRKWLHAVNAEPIAFMGRDALAEEPPGTTDNPYLVLQGGVTAAANKRGGGALDSSGKRVRVEAGDAPLQRGTALPAWVANVEGAADKRTDAGTFFWGEGGGRGARGGGRGAGGRGGGGGRGRGAFAPPDANNNTVVFVGNLTSRDVTARDLQQLFGPVGPIRGTRITPGAVFGFVEFERHDDAARAISIYNGAEFKGNQGLRVGWSQGPQRSGGEAGGGRGAAQDTRTSQPGYHPTNCTVFVGNLNRVKEVREADVLNALVEAGCNANDIAEVRVTQKGYAFVEFKTHAAAAHAIEHAQGASVLDTISRLSWGTAQTAPAGERFSTQAESGGTSGDMRTECWFCLASPQLEEHLISNIAEECYLAMPKGALVPNHALIVPIEHTQRYSDLSDACVKEVEAFKAAMRAYYDTISCELLSFERCVETRGANHMHIQCIPVPAGEAARGARMVLKAEGMRLVQKLKFKELPPPADGSDLRAQLRGLANYLYAEVPGDVPGSMVRLMAQSPAGAVDERGRPAIPMQFGRDVAARLLLMPERAHWKACEVSRVEEAKMAEAFKEAFKAHSPY